MIPTKMPFNNLRKNIIPSLVIIILALIMAVSDIISIYYIHINWVFHLGAILLIPLLAIYGISIYGIRTLSKFFIVFFFGGLIIEILGTRTGIPFGTYEYSSKFQPQLFGIPIQIPLGWFTLGIMSYSIAFFTHFSKLKRILISSFLMMAWDVLYDPIFAAYKIWIWKKGEFFGVPLTNFLGWFAVSLAFFTITEFKTNYKIINKEKIMKIAPLSIYITYMIDGGLQNIILGQSLVSVIGTLLMILGIVIVFAKELGLSVVR